MFINHSKIPTAIGLLAALVITPTFANQNTSINNTNVSYKEMSLGSRFHPSRADIVLQIGGFDGYQGQSQHIGIQGLIGDNFTVSSHTDKNFLVGLGYFIEGFNRDRFSVKYGLNAFYLADTTVKGNVIQEQMFTNLAYSYSVTNYPIYLDAKALVHTDSNKYNITFDLGIGPNFMQTGSFQERSLDGGITIPDNAFSGQTNVEFSATAGVGIKFKNVLGSSMPIEIGYRFFYLGQSNLKRNNNQLLNTLKTGNCYANALVISTSI